MIYLHPAATPRVQVVSDTTPVERDSIEPSFARREASVTTMLTSVEEVSSGTQLTGRRRSAGFQAHTTGTRHPDVTVRTCWDSDRLDLWRVGTRPDPRFLTTELARKLGMIEEAFLRCERDEFPYRKLFVEA